VASGEVRDGRTALAVSHAVAFGDVDAFEG
jgi:hypothetical protein